MAMVTDWSFQKPLWMSERVEEESELSMVNEGKTQGVLEIEMRFQEINRLGEETFERRLRLGLNQRRGKELIKAI